MIKYKFNLFMDAPSAKITLKDRNDSQTGKMVYIIIYKKHYAQHM